ncbi:hypothetical protein J5N97_014880 [Dioscorea zingiberensis]|uniref:Uncharacterized protein n=1 Tax=Dioscorea zingiberensis TaxID=325984 RepID=A0A9D5CTK3_9LILI|nr:hypothetical protein J5N97_014880 [Dioscorea zingiberensis]
MLSTSTALPPMPRSLVFGHIPSPPTPFKPSYSPPSAISPPSPLPRSLPPLSVSPPSPPSLAATATTTPLSLASSTSTPTSSDRGYALSDLLSMGNGAWDSFYRIGGSPVGVALVVLILLLFLLYNHISLFGCDDDE